MTTTIACSYCKTLNSRQADRCVACGAPLEFDAPLPPPPPPVKTGGIDPSQFMARAKSAAMNEPVVSPEVKKATEMADKVFQTAMLTYYIFWRTVAEALAISVTAFALGLIGVATEMHLAGVAGAVLVGLVVGITSKHTWWVVLSAPLGLLAGCLIWICPWAVGLGPKGMVITGALGAMFAARLGAQNIRRTWWEWVRPFLAMLLALALALVGLALGAGMKWLVDLV